MRILTLGGSNTGIKIGWAAHLKSLAPEYEIANRFLGGVGSLFGLLTLLRLPEEDRPDVIVFEYTLNDTLLFVGQLIHPDFTAKVLHEIMTICARRNISLLFLCLCVRPCEGESISEGSQYMFDLYKNAATSRGAPCIMLTDVAPDFSFSDYVDSVHLAAELSQRVAEAVATRLKQPMAPPNGKDREKSFFLADVASARVVGPHAREYLQSPVFSGAFLLLKRGGRIYLDIPGRIVAIMLRSTENSGIYRIRAGRALIAKNAQSVIRKDVPELMTLHYVTATMPETFRTIIDLPKDERELRAIKYDATFMECDCAAPFVDQSIEINSAIFYRDPDRPHRLKRRFFRLWKIYVRIEAEAQQLGERIRGLFFGRS